MAIIHTYQEPGIYTVTLIVKDSDGKESSTTRSIVVKPASVPVPRIQRSAREGQVPLEVCFDAANSIPTAGEIVECRWDFGDNVTGVEAGSSCLEPIPTSIPPGPVGPVGPTGPLATGVSTGLRFSGGRLRSWDLAGRPTAWIIGSERLWVDDITGEIRIL